MFYLWRTVFFILLFCSYSLYKTIPSLLENSRKLKRVYSKDIPQPRILDRRNNVWYLGSNSFDHINIKILKKLQKNITLIFLDAHSDDRVGSKKLDCGNWINRVLKNPHILRVIWIGGVMGLLKETYPWENYKHIETEKIVLFPARDFISYFKGNGKPTSRFVKNIKRDSISAFFGFPGYYLHWYNFVEAIKKEKLRKSIIGNTIYITIDLDVLHARFGKTPWGNGLLTDNDLKFILKYLYKNYRVVGVNICGPEQCLQWLLPYICKISGNNDN